MKLTSILLLCLSFTVNAQTPKPAVSEINTYTAGVDRFVKVNKNHRIFGGVTADLSEDKTEWKQFKTKKELEDQDNVYQNAFVATRNGKVVGADFTFTSPSGDWAHLIMYYFRDDGSLAKIRAQLNTSYGNISVVREQFYDSSGKLLHSTQKFLDLQTKKPKKPGEFMDNPIPLFKKVSELPFNTLL